jgi:hypothetical protein
MAERECAINGKKKDIAGGKTCEKGHFICKDHAYGKKHCPLDGTRLK